MSDTGNSVQERKQSAIRDATSFVNNSHDRLKETKPQLLEMPSISLPRGGGAMKSIDEKFSINPVNGTAAYSIPLPFSTGRKGATPELSLSYNSGGGNSPFGLGWNMSYPCIQRRTEKALPQYRDGDPAGDASEEDVFIFSGAEDLVPVFIQNNQGHWVRKTGMENNVSIQYYRPRIESAFARIERLNDGGNIYWRVRTKDNIVSIFGKSDNAKLYSPVASEGKDKTFRWCLEYSYDDKGNFTRYVYKQENGANVPFSTFDKNRLNGIAPYANLYLKNIRYGNKIPYFEGGTPPAGSGDFLFEMVFDYGEHDPDKPTPLEQTLWPIRQDPFSDFRPGFDIRTYRLCRRILQFHHFTTELGWDDYLVRSLDLAYDEHSHLTYLSSVTQTGYIWDTDGSLRSKQSLPPMEFQYFKPGYSQEVKTVSKESLSGAPVGWDDSSYQWVDLYSEGVPGILSEQAEGWFYKENQGGGIFSPSHLVGRRPSLGKLSGSMALQDLEADGHKYLVSSEAGLRGYYRLSGGDGSWREEDTWPGEDVESFQAFEKYPNIDLKDPNLKFLDLNGDGMPDMLISQQQEFIWYAAKGRTGYDDYHYAARAADEERGPQILFADKDEKMLIATADMSGDGLTDIVLITCAEVCYYPNLGYGRFGARVTLQMAGCFASATQFDPQLIRLADIDGSGTTDIVYIGNEKIQVWFNQGGNSLSTVSEFFNPFPALDNMSRVSMVDLLGTGVSCLTWSSSLPGHSYAPLRYIDLMGGRKPHIMSGYKNNLGKEVNLEYRCSTLYYLDDKSKGKYWATRLPFPMQCVSKVTVTDKVAQTRFTNEYRYHHGYYDAKEREFRGFAMVEKRDCEEYDHFVAAAGSAHATEKDLYQPAVLTKSWFHTGAWLHREQTFHQLENEYFPQALLTDGTLSNNDVIPGLAGYLLDESSVLPDGLQDSAISECFRALKGLTLREEVYSEDGEGNTPLYPYSVVQHNYLVELLQPKVEEKYAVFLTHEKESLACNYERNPLDPRITQTVNIKIDAFGNVLEAAAVSYGRVRADAALPTDADRQKQTVRQIVYTVNGFSTLIDTSPAYRLPVPCEVQRWELNAPAPANVFFTADEISACFAGATVKLFEQDIQVNEKRKLTHSRTLFLKNDLSGPMAFGTQDTLALPYESYALALSPTLAFGIYGGKFDDATWRNKALYVRWAGDANYWIRGGRMYFDPNPQHNFFLPVSFENNTGALTNVFYDTYKLFIQRVVDAAGNESNVDAFHYRVLTPWLLRDANDNRTGVRFNELGMVTHTFTMGKTGESKGDPIDTSTPEISSNDQPSSIIEYNYRWYTSGEELPDQVKVSVREQHYYSEPLPASTSGGLPGWLQKLFGGGKGTPVNPASVVWQDSYTYSDGSGHVVLKKVQAEPGMAPQRDAQGRLVFDGSGNLVLADTSPRLRWVGNGRTIFSNKGKPVKQYEPYFDSSPEYNPELELAGMGFTSILYYDATGRVIRTEKPDGTFSRVAFDAWKQSTYDENDTCLDSGWYKARINGAMGQAEQSAAEKTAVHANTPSVAWLDALGRTFLTLSGNATQRSNETVQTANLYTRTSIDILGNTLDITDARGNTVMNWKYDMTGNICYQHSIDAGDRWILADVAGNAILLWDSRGQVLSHAYDVLNRPLRSWVNTGALHTLFEQYQYGEGVSNDKKNNLRGRIYHHYDTAGLAVNEGFDFKGNRLATTRTLLKDYKSIPDWAASPVLESENFDEETAYDALSRPIQIVAADKSIFIFGYNPAGLLNTVDVRIRGAAAPTSFVTGIDYDAKGQRARIVYGNNTTTQYTYDPQTYRLTRLLTTGAGGNAILQDLRYTYDPVGNITRQFDNAQKTVFYGGQQVEAQNDYIYDALYRLVEGGGREHTGQIGTGPQDNWDDQWSRTSLQPNSPVQLRNYTQKYFYDEVGNIRKMQHIAGAGAGWTRTYQYNTANNQLIKSSSGGQNYLYTYNEHGSMLSMPQLSAVDWNFREELQHAGLGGGGDAWYVYDCNGQRMRKVIEKQGHKSADRIYMGLVEIYRERTGASITLERSSLHVMDDKKRIAMVDTRTKGNDGTPPQLIRYEYNDHLQSACLELDDAGKVISYEEYHPFGTTAYQATDASRQVPAKRYRYTGMERDEESGLGYHTQRYYVPWLGRWLSADPVGVKAGINVYAYCRNNPVTLNDQEGNDPPQQKPSTEQATIRTWQFDPQIPSRFDLQVNQDSTRIRFLGQAKLLDQEHVLVSPPGSPISSSTGSLLLDSASLRFSHHNYSLRLDAQFELTPNFSEPKSWETHITTSATVTPVFGQQDGQYRLFNAQARVATDFVRVDVNARLQLQHTPDAANLTSAATDLVLHLTKAPLVIQNYILHSLGANISFDATLRAVGVPITYIWGNTNILDTTHIYAVGATLAPAGTLFDVPAPLIGLTTYHVLGKDTISGRAGILPLISPSAISEHKPTVLQFPVYGYLSFDYAHPIPHLGTLHAGVEADINIGTTVSPPPPDTSFNHMMDQYHGTADDKPSAQVNSYLKLQF